MKDVAHDLREILNDFTQKIAAIPEPEFSAKPNPHKWSKKEVVGHLVDSAQNNLRRFICAQYEPQPPLITYQQDYWVKVNQYQAMDPVEVVTLWRLLNLRICAVLESMPVEHLEKTCDTGSAVRSISWLATDYVKHMKHHLNQIISGSFDVVYVS